jgi:Ca-activated chloride channel family protein
MLAVDTSRSMLSTDVQPDRLSRAKFAAQDLIDSLTGDRVGLIAFAGTAFVEAPLTIDYGAVENSVNALDTDTIPRGGTNIASAIREAAEAFGKGESAHRALVLFTDGEELEDDAVEAAKEVKGQFRIFTVGVGTREGSLIPLAQPGGGTDFLKDDQGEYVKSKLDEEKLKEIANTTGGFYVHLENGPATAKAIIEQGLRKMQEHEFETRETMPIERYEWPLAAGILLLLASMLIRERRRVERVRAARAAAPAVRREAATPVAAGVAIALIMLVPARGWAVNQGLNLYDQKDYKGAYDVFDHQLQGNPDSAGLEFDRGASAYKEGDYDKALESFGKVLGSPNQGLRGQAEYNLGNTLVQRGALQKGKDEKIKEWTEALKHYDQALKIDPNNPDAKYNEDVVRKMIDDLNKKQQQQQQQNQKDQKNQKDQQNQQNQQSQQNQQNQQNQQQKNQQNQQAQNQQQQGGQGQQQQNQNQQQNQQNQNQQAQNQQGQGQQQQNQQGQGQQQQNQSAQNQQKQGQQGQQSQQNQQDQGQQNQQAQNQQGQGQQNQQQQGQQGQQHQNPQQGGDSGQQNQQQTAQQKQDEQNQASGNPTQNMTGASPSPTPANGPGVLKEQSQQDQQAAAQAAARAATEPARPGEMTPSQAQALIDSLRGEEEQVSFEDRKHPDNEPVYKDW